MKLTEKQKHKKSTWCRSCEVGLKKLPPTTNEKFTVLASLEGTPEPLWVLYSMSQLFQFPKCCCYKDMPVSPIEG